MAGAGPYFGGRTGSLVNFFAPIVPRRLGLINPARAAPSRCRTRSRSPTSPTPIRRRRSRSAMPPNSAELKVTYPPNCPVAKELCGFEEGMPVIIFDTTGHFDTFTVTQVQDDAGHLQHRGQQLNHDYAAGSTITQIVSNTYYRNADDESADALRRRLRRPADRRRRRRPAVRLLRRSEPAAAAQAGAGRGRELPLRRRGQLRRADAALLAASDGSLAIAAADDAHRTARGAAAATTSSMPTCCGSARCG